jgi:hypothetical protein
MSGEGVLASQQTAVYSPFTLIALLMPVALSFTYTAAITFFIAALCAYLLARELGCGEASSLVAAAGWAFATPITLFVLVTMGQAWAWCPLLLVAVHRLSAAPSLHNAGLLTFAFTVILYSGHPESVVLCVMIGMVWGVARRPPLRAIGWAVASGVAALLLSAIHLLPFIEALRASAEYHVRSAMFVDAQPTVTLHTSLMRIAATLFPYLHERYTAELEIGAVGSIVLALAVYAAVRVRTARFLGALALLSLVVHAEWTPVVVLLRTIPLVELALTDRLSFAFALCAAVMAALGVEELVRRRDRLAAVVMSAVLVAIAAGNWWATHTPLVSHEPLRFGAWKVWAELGGLGLAIAIVGGAAAFSRSRLSGGLKPAAPLLLALILAQRAVSDGGLYHSFEQEQAYPPVPLFSSIERGAEPHRIVATGNLFTPQTATLYDLEDVRGVPSLTLRAYAETYALWCRPQPVWFQRVDDVTRPFLSFLNVRYALSDKPAPPGWRQVAQDRGTYLHENTRVLPRAFVPASVSAGYPRLWNLADLLAAKDFSSHGWIETKGPRQTIVSSGTVRTRATRGGYTLHAEMHSDGWIVTSIPDWPGWQATIDGHAAETAIANHAFVGVKVPKGRHRVELRYWPRTFVIGAGVTIATLALLACAILLIPRYGQR